VSLKLSVKYEPFIRSVIMLIAIMVSVVMLSVVMLSVVMLRVVALYVSAYSQWQSPGSYYRGIDYSNNSSYMVN
jgi:hypothetical protein